MAPRKVRMIANLLKGLPVNEAEALLLMQARRPAKPLLKLLRSAVANAKNNQKLDPDKLAVKSILVNNAGMLKRFLPRARGSASPIQKKLCHVVLTLKELDKAPKKRFTFIVAKKSKKEEKLKNKAPKKEVGAEETNEKGAEQKQKFFKRMFRRKAV